MLIRSGGSDTVPFMPSVVFVAPFFLPTTLRFIDAVASLPGVATGLVSQDPSDRLPPALRARLAAHERVEDALDAERILAGTRALIPRIGPVSRVLGTLEELQVPLGIVRERLGIEGMGAEAARNFRDKSRMKTVLRAAGLPCARHRLCAADADAWGFVREIGYPVVAKPPAGAGSKNTFRIDDDAGLKECLGWMHPSPAQPLLLEEFVVGEEFSFDTVSIKGRPVWHSITRYFPGPLDVMRNPWIQWCVLLPREVDHPAFDDMKSVAYRSLDALGMGTGLCHMEWFRRKDGSVAVSEVGARPPGAQITNLIAYAHDIDIWKAWAKLMVFDVFDPPERKYASGIAFLRGQGSGRVVRVHGLDQAQKEMGHLVVEVSLPREGQPQGSGYEGEGFVILRHPETSVVEKALQRVVSLVRVELGGAS